MKMILTHNKSMKQKRRPRLMMVSMTRVEWDVGEEDEDAVGEDVAGASTMARAGTVAIQSVLLQQITAPSIRWCQSRLLVRVCRMARKDLPWGGGSRSSTPPLLFNVSGSPLPCSEGLARRWMF